MERAAAGDWIVAADGVPYSLDPADTIVPPDLGLVWTPPPAG